MYNTSHLQLLPTTLFFFKALIDVHPRNIHVVARSFTDIYPLIVIFKI